MSAQPQKIFETASSVLIIKPRAIGDVLLATPVIRNLKLRYPHLNIDFLCERFAADVIAGNPSIRTIKTFNKKSDSTFSIVRMIRAERYDIVIDLFCNPRTAVITWLSGAKHRIGFPFRGRSYAYTIFVQPRGGEVHNVDFNLDVLRHLDVPVHEREPFFFVDEKLNIDAREWLSRSGISNRTIIGINAGGGWYTKKWRKDSFARLADELAKGEQTSVLFFWGPGEMEEVESIRSFMKRKSYIIPKTSLKEMGAFLRQCSYLISNDSGPMHIAASLGVPTLGIFGPTNPHLQGPFGSRHVWVRNESLDCLECNLTACPIGNICMQDLAVETVLNAFNQLKSKH